LNNISKIKLCGRCKKSIECLAENIAQCVCSQININGGTSTFLNHTKFDCLCNNCLKEIDDMITKSKDLRFPESRTDMIEGIHYYVENGYFVFTELYHVLRGKCCQSGCRHCAYGFKNS
jgi:hypothetical protein